jgi:glycosyltransferase involved in cell wall biosynthesis
MQKLKIALAHDYLREYGGAERVLEVLHEMFPDAPVYTAFFDKESLGIHASKFEGWDIHQSFMTKIPFYKKLYSPLRVLANNCFEKFDLSAYDLVISSSNAYMAKAVQVPNGKHICYCHTPPRSLYGYETMSDWKKNPIIKVVGTLINHYMRVIDFKVAQRVDQFVANSLETARRIKKFYRRDSLVINPPVELPSKLPISTNLENKYYLYINRLAWAKHPELAVQAATQLDLPLKLAGTGKMFPKLKAMAGPTVEFLGAVSDEQLKKLYAGAKALFYPVKDEDFGMIPIEAMGYGVPVIAHKSGGPQETVIEGKTGIFFENLTVGGLIEVIEKFSKMKFDAEFISNHAKKYNKDIFKDKILKLVKKYN